MRKIVEMVKKEKDMEKNKNEVIEFKKKIENKVNIDHEHEVEVEAKILSELKMVNELVVNTDDEMGVMPETERELIVGTDSMIEENGIESDIRTVNNER